MNRMSCNAWVLAVFVAGCGGKAESLPGTEAGDSGAMAEAGNDAPVVDAGADATQADTGADVIVDGPDCGSMWCIDCGCTCPDGTAKMWGGCFDACDDASKDLGVCTKDCLASCGPNMKPCPKGTECAAGYQCVTPPCDSCPVMPEPICLAEPCEPDGCYTGADCGEGSKCVGAEVSAGKFGQCLPALSAGQCWFDSDCPTGSTCWGAMQCPVCQSCNSPTIPGVCKGGSLDVVLWVAKEQWYSQQSIVPTWFNFLPEPIYLPGCVTYDIEGLEQGMWKNLGSLIDCGWEGVAVKVPPGGAHETHGTMINLSAPSWFYSRYRFRGYWYTGCEDGLPISEAKCVGAHEVLSREFEVQWPPD